MKNLSLISLLAAICLSLVPKLAFAQGTEGKFSLLVQKLQNRGKDDAGYTLGLRSSTYFTDSKFYYGMEANIGSSSGKRLESDHIAYGGLALGTDGVIQGAVTYDVSTLLGYGFGSRTDGPTGHMPVIQPTVSLGLLLRSGYRASFSAGYMFTPGQSSFSTMTFGIRIEHKFRYTNDSGNN